MAGELTRVGAEARAAPAGPPKVVAEEEARRLSLPALSILALLVGLITGLGAFVFRELIGLVHNVLFLGQLSFAYDSSVFTPPHPWGAFVILVPVIGAIGVTFLVVRFAPEAKGHGVPEVMDAIYYGNGVIRPVVAVVKSLASALAIGSGAAVGREGPIIQIGSALGSTLGQLLPMSAGQRITLVAAGAGGGIAATFNTPIGGVLFATELMMPEISVNTFLPVALATGAATFVGRLFFGDQPAFVVPAQLAAMPTTLAGVPLLFLYALLGLVVGIGAAAFIRGLALAEDVFDRVPGRYTRHALGMLLIGIMIYAFQRAAGHYYVEGVGYAAIQSILGAGLTAPLFLLLLAVAKLGATATSLGSGSSGGVFSPSLFMGATIGAAFAAVAGQLAPGLPISLPAFAMVGMGAMVGGATGAAMTAVTMIFEMTRDYDIVLPMIVAVAMSLGTRRLLSRENIYTLKLFRRGHAIPKALHANLFMVRRAEDVMERDILVLDASTDFERFLDEAGGKSALRHVVVTDGPRIRGVIRVNTGLRRAVGKVDEKVTLGELASTHFTVVRASDAVFDVIARLGRRRAWMAIVVGPCRIPRAKDVLGVITKEHVADAVGGSIKIYAR